MNNDSSTPRLAMQQIPISRTTDEFRNAVFERVRMDDFGVEILCDVDNYTHKIQVSNVLGTPVIRLRVRDMSVAVPLELSEVRDVIVALSTFVREE